MFSWGNSTSTSSYDELLKSKDETIAAKDAMIQNLEKQIEGLTKKLEDNSKEADELATKFIALNQEHRLHLNQKEK